MNDPFEGHNSMFANSRQNVFSSSWTAESRDELPMWKMYTDLKGVRLRMPIDLFNHSDTLEIVRKGRQKEFLVVSQLNKTYLIEMDASKMGLMKKSFEVKTVYGPSRVDYFETEELLEKGVVSKSDKADFDLREIDTILIGQRKFDYWSFEKEYRFRIFSSQMIAGSVQVLNAFENDAVIKTEFIDVEFKKESLNNCEIILGPLTDQKHIEEINQILEKRGIENPEVSLSRIKIQ